jgi:dihydrofolate reductase
MRKVSVFNTVSLDGYFTDEKNDMSWAHQGGDDPEYQAFTNDNAGGGGALIFGRVTYELMASFWPTPQAAKQMPKVAEQMNNLSKVVFSKTLNTVDWQNTKLVKTDPAAEIRKMKQESGPDMVIMGSGTIVSQLTQAGLIDEYQIIVQPLILGKGRTMFDGITKRVAVKPMATRTFKNGKIFIRYEPLG